MHVHLIDLCFDNKIILSDSNTNLLYLVTIPEKIYCELTKKENKS